MVTKVGGVFTGPESEAELETARNRLLGRQTMQERVVEVEFGRTMKVRYGQILSTTSCAAWVGFLELCARGADGSALGAPDFLALTNQFPVVFLHSVPQLRPSQRDEARRLVTLIDTLYEARCQLFMSTQCSVHEIFEPLFEADRAAKEAASGFGDRASAVQSDYASLELTQEEKLMFSRAISRLIELCVGGNIHIINRQ
mmetsp:Transcript_35388/g.67696  ORF Transcript_35388/g.67696 Transcript_35388/m.67696 type:complete len:200 (+) Transcript_35388:310-909(+)